MAKRRKRRGTHGHFCWCCGCMRSNEKFSGRGHARHLCKACSRLDKDELAYRQAERDIGRVLSFDGIIRRRQRAAVERFLGHANPRIHDLARKVILYSDRELQQRRKERRRDREAEEAYWAAMHIDDGDGELLATRDPMEHDESECAYLDEEEIPF